MNILENYFILCDSFHQQWQTKRFRSFECAIVNSNLKEKLYDQYCSGNSQGCRVGV